MPFTEGSTLATVFWFFLVPFALLIGVIILPQRNRQKKQKEFIDNLSVKDKVVTYSGIIGVIEKIGKRTIILRVDEKTRMEFLKEAITKLAKDLD